MRKPDSTIDRYELGHWEAMEIGIALGKLADETMSRSHQIAIRNLQNIFRGEALYSIERKEV